MKKPESPYQYSEIVAFFDEQKIEKYTFDLGTGELTFTLKGSTQEETYTVPNVNLFVSTVQEQVEEQNRAQTDPANKIPYELIPIQTMPFWVSYLPTLLLIVAMGALWWFTMKQSRGGGNISGFGKAKARTPDQGRKVLFEDVAGADEEKAELVEVVEFLKNPEKFNTLGARIPKGILLVGPPGTGKTLLARAVAGEAGVPFFSISGSDFVEMFVGVGASRVRDLFDQAKKNAPAIVFIDEIDAVGRQRGAGLGGGHDEREQTLNQLLVEMDGFGSNSGVIIIAATNRRDILDPALLRPGRFDRQIIVGYPDIRGREAILKVHARNKPLGPDVDLKVIASTTAGFTGADLENILNEAALLAARRNLKAITMPAIEEATIKVIAGPEKKSRLVTEKDKKLTAYHEAGHAVVTFYMDTADKVHQVSIIPRGMAGGYTMSLPSEDKSYHTRREMQQNIITLLGGRVAELLVLDDISTGASNDLERATALARSMVTRYGFSDKLGPVVYGHDQSEVFLGRDFNQSRNYSEGVATEIDNEIRNLVEQAYELAKHTLQEHMDQLILIAETLMEQEKIDAVDFESLMTTGRMADRQIRVADAPTGAVEFDAAAADAEKEQEEAVPDAVPEESGEAAASAEEQAPPSDPSSDSGQE
ncbi:ATP-dependent zinc metalloprotease FtsH [Yanshouia hominis]|uniref:ATP-dependent zinc metalloprotease FtsH n=1 Tax=Yanshouia hominis TaxID=2763673 RepID=A0ABR7NIT6_9FIRM|nr:ATP-dependent zinc metalloprotease FtsH [Yanshouia hominis]